MNTITVKDGTTIYYKDWGTGPVVTFSHGWPLNADAWDAQMLFFAQNGFRVVAHDRRGHGRSSQASSGNDMNGYADDLAAVLDTLDLKDAILVGHSTGGGEVVRYIGRHGTKRVAGVVLIAAVPPLLLKTPANPEGLPVEVFDGLRSGLVNDRSQFYKDFCAGLFTEPIGPARRCRKAPWTSSGCGACRPVSRIRTRASRRSRKPTSTEDLKKIDVPTLVMHGEDDQIVPSKGLGEEVRATDQRGDGNLLSRSAARSHRPHMRTSSIGILLAFCQQRKQKAA
jgi:non-heme chloroperoxidase